MNKMQVFTNPEFGEIRAIEIDGEPWCVGKDIARALGYADTKSALADHVDAEDKRIIQRGQIATLDIPNRGLTIINESGLYSLILSSKLPGAKKFKRWVTSEVLPAIRKTGTYTMPSTEPQAPKSAPVKLRDLTTDDYINASRIISDCRNERLPYVIGLLEMGGFVFPKVERTTKDRPASNVHIEKTYTIINLDDFLI